MGAHHTSELKEIKKQYGDSFVYSYGNIPGACDFYVYRIAVVNDDGDTVDLPWPQVQKRAKDMYLKTVPQFSTHFIYDGYPDLLLDTAAVHMSGPSTLDDSHIREGVVLRVESPDGEINYYKSKSFEFGVLEGYLKNTEEYVDTEEVA